MAAVDKLLLGFLNLLGYIAIKGGTRCCYGGFLEHTTRGANLFSPRNIIDVSGHLDKNKNTRNK